MRPGVATRDGDLALEVLHLLVERSAAVERGHPHAGHDLPSGASTSTTCFASWRVGTSTSAVGWPGIGFAAVCSIGRPNASVLPEPVRALPHTSRPSSASAIVAS